MPQDDPYRIYVIHNWEIDDDYLRFFEYLGDARNFFYINTSDPEAYPQGGDREAIQKTLQAQMRTAEVVVLMSTLFGQHIPLVDYQITMAKAFKKPIVGMEPFGPNEVPITMKQHTNDIVAWYDRSIVDAIKQQARGEPTNRWEVIDFP